MLFGFIIAALIAVLAVRAKALANSGGIAACFVGGLILGFGGWLFGGALLAFFVTSTVLGRISKFLKLRPTFNHTVDTYAVLPEKGGRRDAMQVLANGGIAALCSVLHGVSSWHAQSQEHLFTVLFLTSLATANGDTWATEIGSAFGGRPRLITTWKNVPSGTSGGVTLAGTVASAAGAGLLSSFAFSLDGKLAATIWVCGVSGVMLDSILGATLQAQWMDPTTGNYTEKLPAGVHSHKGLSWMRNDQVNILSIIAAVILALYLYCKI